MMKNNRMEIDLIGQYYTSINNHKQPGIFALSVYLKEDIKPEVLQQAVKDLMKRLPFLNGRVHKGFFSYQYEMIRDIPKVEPDIVEPLFCDYYNRGKGHMIKVVYGKSLFTVKATHSICDGRGLSKITIALLIRYFELLGININKDGYIDCNEKGCPEEAEDAAKRFFRRPPYNSRQKARNAKKIYVPAGEISEKQYVFTKTFEADKIKAEAKKYNATVGEYLLAHIFYVLAKKRKEEHGTGSINCSVQIDCRSFFPSKSLRSFVTDTNVVMPESEDFSGIIHGVTEQFQKITAKSVYETLYPLQQTLECASFVPRNVKSFVMKYMARTAAENTTTGISNLGLIKLPDEIKNYVERIEFPIAIELGYTNFFSCATVGNTLAFTATYRSAGKEIVKEVMDSIEERTKRM